MGTSNPAFRLVPRARCDRCGKVTYIDKLQFDGYKKGALVCEQCWDPWHPQLDVRGRSEDTRVPNARHVETSSEAQFYDTYSEEDLVDDYNARAK